MEYFQFSQEEALEALGVDPRRGLSRGEVQRRRAKYGKNQLETAKRRGVLRQFLGQFQDLMVLILLAAAAVSFGVSWVRGDGEYVDSLIILAIVVVNAVIGTVQERRAYQAGVRWLSRRMGSKRQSTRAGPQRWASCSKAVRRSSKGGRPGSQCVSRAVMVYWNRKSR